MEATKLLKKDHAKVKQILEELVDTTARSTVKRRELLQTLKQELDIHEKVEEKLFYPKLKPGDKEQILEAYEEHHLVDKLLAEIENTEVTDEHWKAKITVLQENLLHHIKEEEHEIFPRAHKELGEKVLNKMGEDIQAMKEKANA
ncbi:MAG: hemerythrin domain-containing protein [Gammaproteobacteria bacterium]|nr:hemerythrin domain-containing protein [Gammaproteobacteria bacterium]